MSEGRGGDYGFAVDPRFFSSRQNTSSPHDSPLITGGRGNVNSQVVSSLSRMKRLLKKSRHSFMIIVILLLVILCVATFASLHPLIGGLESDGIIPATGLSVVLIYLISISRTRVFLRILQFSAMVHGVFLIAYLVFVIIHGWFLCIPQACQDGVAIWIFGILIIGNILTLGFDVYIVIFGVPIQENYLRKMDQLENSIRTLASTPTPTHVNKRKETEWRKSDD
ncbi:MAG: hypothetical protein ACTSUE_10585 [Promethearchaeota archaeon]